MIPSRIVQYLEDQHVPYKAVPHERAITGQQLAAACHVTGYHVAKPVLVEADGRTWMAVLPAAEQVDADRLAVVLQARSARLLNEGEFTRLFPGCEGGAEPPLGPLYGLPVVLEQALARADRIVFQAGSHEDAVELSYDDFARLEGSPVIGSFGRVPFGIPRAEPPLCP